VYDLKIFSKIGSKLGVKNGNVVQKMNRVLSICIEFCPYYVKTVRKPRKAFATHTSPLYGHMMCAGWRGVGGERRGHLFILLPLFSCCFHDDDKIENHASSQAEQAASAALCRSFLQWYGLQRSGTSRARPRLFRLARVGYRAWLLKIEEWP
jgi:hypothetical protein